jgi:hypothetical protein
MMQNSILFIYDFIPFLKNMQCIDIVILKGVELKVI